MADFSGLREGKSCRDPPCRDRRRCRAAVLHRSAPGLPPAPDLGVSSWGGTGMGAVLLALPCSSRKCGVSRRVPPWALVSSWARWGGAKKALSAEKQDVGPGDCGFASLRRPLDGGSLCSRRLFHLPLLSRCSSARSRQGRACKLPKQPCCNAGPGTGSVPAWRTRAPETGAGTRARHPDPPGVGSDR